jgi:signal transduction histidine kinase
LLTAWIRRLAADSPSTDQNRSYEAAYDLLSQLRTVSRQLAGGLDAVSLAQALLQSLRAELPYDRGAVFVRAEGGRLVPLALDGASFVDWDTSLADDTPLGRAWEATGPTVAAGPLGDAVVSNGLEPGPRSYTVLPLRMGDRTFGLVALEADRRPVSVTPAMDLVNEAALRLETALLFGEVRSIATSEERRRLAREIHDGIAQELASLGYAVDDLVAEASASEDGKRRNSAVPISDILRKLRGEITRMVSELRLSIFDLRSEVQAQVGLGSALSDYVRAVSVGTTFSVHVILDEAPDRLPIAVEAELLRIAQEAITNARKHAKAEHLWVTCRVDPPFAHLRVEDDGNGLGSKRHDSFGLEVMRERAARLGGQLTIGSREPHGTFVDVRLGERRTGTDTDDLDPDASAEAAGFGHGTVASPQEVEMASAERRRDDEEESRDGRNSAAR